MNSLKHTNYCLSVRFTFSLVPVSRREEVVYSRT